MKRKHLALALSCCLPALVHAAPELSGTPHELSQYLLEQKRIIAIQGQAEHKVEADRAVVAIAVKTKESQLSRALERNETLRSEIRETLQQAGIDPQAIKASRFSSTPDYGWFGDKPSSYEVNNEIKISITDEAQLQAIAKLVDSRKEVFFGNMEFEDSAREANEGQALESALKDARQQRRAYEQSLGLVLSPLRVSSQHVFARSAQPQPRLARDMMQREGASLSQAPPAANDFGSITYSANIVVEFVNAADAVGTNSLP